MSRHPVRMPGRGTERHALRIPDSVWERLGDAANAEGTDRATIARLLIRWWLGDIEAPPDGPWQDTNAPPGQ